MPKNLSKFQLLNTAIKSPTTKCVRLLQLTAAKFINENLEILIYFPLNVVFISYKSNCHKLQVLSWCCKSVKHL